jgi:hypothetical protein
VHAIFPSTIAILLTWFLSCAMCNYFCLPVIGCTFVRIQIAPSPLILTELMVSANPNLKCMVQAWMQCHFCMFYKCCAYICHLLLRGTMCLDQDQK